MPRFSLDELTTLTEAQAVRRRLDAYNVQVLRFLLWACLLVCVIEIPVALKSEPASHARARLAISLANLALVLVAVPVVRRVARGCPPTGRDSLDALARGAGRQQRGIVLGFLYLQFALLAGYGFFGATKEPWFFVYPVVLVLFRVTVSEALLLHAAFILTAVIESLLDRLVGGASFPVEFFVAIAFVHAAVLAGDRQRVDSGDRGRGRLLRLLHHRQR